MLTYKKLARKPRSFQSFTGIGLEQFDFLSSEIEKEYKRTEQRRLSRKKRERKIGAGRRFALPVRDRLMMLLVYYRMYITYELAGHLFGLDQSNVYRDIRYMEPAVRGSIPIPQKMMYAESKKIGTIQELKRHFPEFRVMIDSSEQQIPRPKKNKKKRQTYYSGKKGMHTVKNQYTVNLKGQIVHKPPLLLAGRMTTRCFRPSILRCCQKDCRRLSTWDTREWQGTFRSSIRYFHASAKEAEN